MDRRESIKTLLIGSIAGATITSAAGCAPEEQAPVAEKVPLYGRTPAELERDAEIRAEIFLNEHELESIAVLCDLILPATATAVSATGAGVPEFIEFIVKDLPSNQLPVRGGLMWLDLESKSRFEKEFKAASPEQQKQLLDDIAYPDPDNKKPELAYGIRFFNRMRNMTLTGYYTSQEGIKDLGYVGNVANIWDGVPEDVLKKHEMDFDPGWLAKCVDQSKRNEIAQWDDQGNLLT